MPELPEVETVIRTLEYQLGNVTITNVKVNWDNIIAYPSVDEFTKKIRNQRINRYNRYGKYLIFELDDFYFIAHMRMEGKFYVQKPSDEITKHMHVIFDLSDGRQLRYHDTRKFGKMYLYEKKDGMSITDYDCFNNIGVDAFSENLTVDYLKKKLKNKKYTLKQFLLDQSIIAGIGNIYADEIAFEIGLHPLTRVSSLDENDFTNIISATRKILTRAIEAGGTTIRSYTSQLGVDGRFQLQLKVHMREGEKCVKCKNIIEKIKVGGRGTYVCKKCQKIK